MANTTNKQQIVMDIIRGIQTDIHLYDKLYTLQNSLQKCFLTFDGITMQRVLDQQVPILNTLGKSAQTRSNHLQQLGLNATNNGMKSLIQALPVHLQSKVSLHWNQLETKIVACQTLNHLNGELSATFSELLTPLGQRNDNDYASDRLMKI